MKYMTIQEIKELQRIIEGRRARVEGLKKMLQTGVKKSDLDWIHSEIIEHEHFCAKMEKKVKAFYAPAVA